MFNTAVGQVDEVMTSDYIHTRWHSKLPAHCWVGLISVNWLSVIGDVTVTSLQADVESKTKTGFDRTRHYVWSLVGFQ